MIRASCLRPRLAVLTWAGLTALTFLPNAAAQERPVYRCPGNLYTDQITPKEAAERGCRTLDGAPVTVVQGAAGAGVLLGGSLLALLFSSVLLIPLGMALWFAPMLVLFNGMPPIEACKASFNACLKNILPFLLLGLIVFVLSFFAALPVGLGFLVLIPVLAGTAYAAYQDVFVAY